MTIKHKTFAEKVIEVFQISLTPEQLAEIALHISVPKIIFSDTEPINIEENDIWINTSE